MPNHEKDYTARVAEVLQPSRADRDVENKASNAAVERDVVDRVTCRAGDDSCATAHASTINRATDSRPVRASHSLLQLQRQYGNRYVERVLSLAREDIGESSGTGVSPGIENAIQQKRGGGNSLDTGVRKQMEGAMGADFSGVRMHTDTEADSLNHSLSARAFTTGQDIFFRQGAYEPGSSTGRELIAHELTHVVQQGGSQVRRAMDVSQPGDPHEVEAEHTARAIMQRESTGSKTHEEEEKEKHSAPSSHVSASFQRQPEAPKKDEEEEKKKHHAMMKADLKAIVSSSSQET